MLCLELPNDTSHRVRRAKRNEIMSCWSCGSPVQSVRTSRLGEKFIEANTLAPGACDECWAAWLL